MPAGSQALRGVAGRALPLARRGFYRSRAVRRVVAAARRTELPDLAHLTLFDDSTAGPVQRDEALLLHALVRVTRPETIVEIGFLRGRSSLNFLRAMDPGAHLFSFDINPICAPRAAERFGHDPRFTFRTRSQDALTAEDIDGRTADLVFLDASHDLALNQATFERILPLLAPEGIVAVHDTGAIPRSLVPPGHWWLQSPDGWVGDAREVMPDERAFVNWVAERYPEFSEIHLHSRRAMRLGLTLLQRAVPLPRP